ASAQTSDPTLNASRMIVSMRALPNRSPNLPASGVHTEADSREPVTTHDDAAVVVENVSAMCGSAGTTSVCDSANESAAISSAARTGTAGRPWTVWSIRGGSGASERARAGRGGREAEAPLPQPPHGSTSGMLHSG